jgi:small subunit ribosomal protein S20
MIGYLTFLSLKDSNNLSTTSTTFPMPNKDNAKKAVRQSEKRAQHVKVIKSEIKSLRVHLRKMIDAKNHPEALKLVQLVGKKFDKAVSKNIFKKNTAARYKSRLMQKVNALLAK